MAAAKKCDRCGRFFEPYSMWNGVQSGLARTGKPNCIIFARLDSKSRSYCKAEYDGLPKSEFATDDLCEECMDELLQWWRAGGAENA